MKYLDNYLTILFPVLLAILFNYSIFDWRYWVINFYFALSMTVAYFKGQEKIAKIKDEQLKQLGGIFTDVKHKIIKKW